MLFQNTIPDGVLTLVELLWQRLLPSLLLLCLALASLLLLARLAQGLVRLFLGVGQQREGSTERLGGWGDWVRACFAGGLGLAALFSPAMLATFATLLVLETPQVALAGLWGLVPIALLFVAWEGQAGRDEGKGEGKGRGGGGGGFALLQQAHLAQVFGLCFMLGAAFEVAGSSLFFVEETTRLLDFARASGFGAEWLGKFSEIASDRGLAAGLLLLLVGVPFLAMRHPRASAILASLLLPIALVLYGAVCWIAVGFGQFELSAGAMFVMPSRSDSSVETAGLLLFRPGFGVVAMAVVVFSARGGRGRQTKKRLGEGFWEGFWNEVRGWIALVPLLILPIGLLVLLALSAEMILAAKTWVAGGVGLTPLYEAFEFFYPDETWILRLSLVLLSLTSLLAWGSLGGGACARLVSFRAARFFPIGFLLLVFFGAWQWLESLRSLGSLVQGAAAAVFLFALGVFFVRRLGGIGGDWWARFGRAKGVDRG